MKQRVGTALVVLGMTLATALIPTTASARPPTVVAPPSLTVPGNNYYPESISASVTGQLFVGSITTGAVVRFRPGVWQAEPFLAPGINIGTAGVLVDDARRVLWTCAIDLSFQTATEVRAFRLTDGGLAAAYTLPDRGVCADLALAAGGDVYVTDTTDPTVVPRAPGRIFRLQTPTRTSPTGGALTLWSADPLLTAADGGLQINGLAYDGRRSFYAANYSSGDLVRIDRARDGAALPAVQIPLARTLTSPDGIRMLDRYRLLVTENVGRLSIVNVRTGAVSLVTDALDQPTSVVRAGKHLWVTEGQVLRLQQGQAPNLPFTVRRVPLPSGH